MIELFFWPTPNGYKATITLAELGLLDKVTPIDILSGEQFDPAYLELNPNNKVPTIIDHDGPGGKPVTIFESGAILLYLAEKTGKLLPKSEFKRLEAIQWLFFQVISFSCSVVVLNRKTLFYWCTFYFLLLYLFYLRDIITIQKTTGYCSHTYCQTTV